MARRIGGAGGPGAGLMSIGKSKAKVYVETGVAEPAHARARRILEEGRALLEEAARRLLAQETLADPELPVVLERVVITPVRPAAALPIRCAGT